MPALMIHHVDLAVSDVDRSLEFYRAVLGPLGLGSHVRPVTDGEGDENVYPTYRATEDVVYLRWGDQFIAFRQADGGEHRYYEVGIEHIAFYVDAREDVDAAYQRCLDIGARIHFPPEEDRDMPGYYEMFVFDPDGMRVEIAFSPAVTVGGVGRNSAAYMNEGSGSTETAVLAGGCFWPAQELLRRRDGVISTRVGYIGGESDNPTDENHSGHTEAVEVVFDPERVSYREILEFFLQIHRADLGRHLVGFDYRSEIFYTSDEQRQIAEGTIADADASDLHPGKVVTEISEAGRFWEASPEDQDYLQRHPDDLHLPLPAGGLEAATRRDRGLA